MYDNLSKIFIKILRHFYYNTIIENMVENIRIISVIPPRHAIIQSRNKLNHHLYYLYYLFILFILLFTICVIYVIFIISIYVYYYLFFVINIIYIF